LRATCIIGLESLQALLNIVDWTTLVFKQPVPHLNTYWFLPLRKPHICWKHRWWTSIKTSQLLVTILDGELKRSDVTIIEASTRKTCLCAILNQILL